MKREGGGGRKRTRDGGRDTKINFHNIVKERYT